MLWSERIDGYRFVDCRSVRPDLVCGFWSAGSKAFLIREWRRSRTAQSELYNLVTMGKTIEVYKYHSYQNDFLIIPSEQLEEGDYARLSSALCQAHSGLGADGCIMVGSDSVGEFTIRIFNRDGSEAGMSGNGARCACAFLHHRGWVRQPEIQLKTKSGKKTFRLVREADRMWEYRCKIGEPSFRPGNIPFRAAPGEVEVADLPLTVSGQEVTITALSVGNPQCVVFVETFPETAVWHELGAALEAHSRFPRKTNVSFVRVDNPHRLSIRIWERGVGPTHSSGTGCAGAAVAAVWRGRAKSPLEVHTTTGSQQVEWEPGRQIVLTGRSEFIADARFLWRTRG